MAKCYVLFEDRGADIHPYLLEVFMTPHRAKAAIVGSVWDGLVGKVKGFSDGDKDYFIQVVDLDTDAS